MTEKELKCLQRIEKEVDKEWDKLSIWERNFVEDIMEKFRQYGDKTRMSPRQWEILIRLAEDKIY